MQSVRTTGGSAAPGNGTWHVPEGAGGHASLAGIDVDKNAIQRIECGKRFVTDIELKVLARVLGVTTDELLQ